MELYEHQKAIIKEDKKKTGLFLGTGSAKTATALHMARGKILCITPKLQKEEENFKREAKKWGLDLDITSISKETFRRDAHLLPRFDTVIIDEAHTISGVTPSIRYVKRKAIPKASQLYDTLIAYLKDKQPERLYLLTATPTRSPMCVWGIAQILGYNWNFYEFRDIFYISVKKGFREFFIVKSDKGSKERLGRIVRRLGYTGKLDDYFDVPEQIYKKVTVELTAKQKERLSTIETEFPDPLVLIGKKYQIENGILAGDEFTAPEIIDDNKTERIVDFAIEFPKMIVFAKYTAQIKKIKDRLVKEGYYVLTLEGSTKDRAQVIKDAESRTECIMIIQSQISAGYELPSFPVVVYASMSYSIVDRLQSEGRVLRANHLKKNLYITLVSTGEIDNAVFKAIALKQDFNEAIYAKERS